MTIILVRNYSITKLHSFQGIVNLMLAYNAHSYETLLYEQLRHFPIRILFFNYFKVNFYHQTSNAL